jgi:outer membrane immunogenic protein
MSRMKTVPFLGCVVMVCVALATNANAGPEPFSGKEMKEVAPVAPSCDYDWTGFYIGAHVGYGWGAGDTHFEALPTEQRFFALKTTTLDPDASGVFGGGQLGYNYQWHKLVFGAETDFSGADFDGTRTRTPITQVDGTTTEGILTAREKTDWFGTARLRVGYTPACRLLLYGTGGLAYGHTQYFANTDFLNGVFYAARADETNLGWTAGGGAEFALSHHWSIKAEYLYYDLGSQHFTGLDSTGGTFFSVSYDAHTVAHTVNCGINFKF